ncbi:hypothetical protein O181_013775 [Austropuccinia psidii MF-1]|uniref:Uncharacterized protein n=1 Tax=Austropuccinia psidii MF-1 TaxID=1389203 RepID=A0A9Q3C0K6_9BASI|nr:hypothetical protein [Austropuccinia psidii MF-1]
MEYRYHKESTHDWVTLLPALYHREITLTGRKRVEPHITCGSTEENILTVHPTAKDFHNMWKNACDKAANCIAEAKEYNKQRLIVENAVEVRLTEEFSRKQPVVPVSLIRPYSQTGEDKFPFRKKTSTPPDIVEV